MKLKNMFLATLLIIGCGLTTLPNDNYYDKIYVSNVVIKDESGEITDTIKINHNFTVEIYGAFPDPCWEFHKIEVEELKNEFRITPIAKREKSKICPQVITPCTTQVKLLCKSASDTLKVSVIGKTEKISKTINVIR